MTEPAPAILVERDDAVLVLTINCPEVRNALTDAVLEQLVSLIAEAQDDPGTRCIVLAGSSKVFASGADIRALLDRDHLQIYGGRRGQLWERLRNVRTPMVAAVSGFCLGGGCELAMICDLVIASDTARFGLPETVLGLIPGAGGTQMLPRAIGKAKAMDMVLTGRMLSAEEAERAGLVSRVVGDDAWLTEAREVARTIASRSAVAQTLAKESVETAFDTGLPAGIAAERKAFSMAFASADAKEGMNAFVEKRSPTWQHR